MMEYFLVLYISAASVIIPEKYPSQQACNEAGKVWEHYSKCIPAPAKREYTVKDVQPLDRMPACINSVDGFKCK